MPAAWAFTPCPRTIAPIVGYWIGLPYWGRGLATAALRLIIEFGFETLQLNRIAAGHFPQNPASGRVMQKANMRYEGTLRGALLHRDTYKDELRYAILREEFRCQQGERRGKKERDRRGLVCGPSTVIFTV